MARRRPKPDRLRALELLAASHDGCTEAIMHAHGFTVAQLAELVRSGLATAQAERVVGGGKTMGVARADHRGGAAGAGGSMKCATMDHDGCRYWIKRRR